MNIDDLPKKLTEGSIIALFDKTSDPEKDSDIFCPHFWELKYANGCHYDCAWCYLNGTFFRRPQGKSPYLKDLSKIERDLREALIRIDEQTMFNAGEVSDALVYPSALLNTIIPLFSNTGTTKHNIDDREDVERKSSKREFMGTNPHGHKLLLLTKSDDTIVIQRANAPEQVIFAYSVNAFYMANTWELEAPHPVERLAASRKAVEFGYETRLRLDPMVPVKSWKAGYKYLVHRIMEVNPWATVITLGSLRGLTSTVTFCEKAGNDMSWVEYLEDTTNWGKRIPEDKRVEMYAYVIRELRMLGYAGDIALCKESIGVWNTLREMEMEIKGEQVPVMDYGPGDVKCNCVL